MSDDLTDVDWSACPLVERFEGKLSGVPLLRGTRMPAQSIIDNIDAGMTPSDVAETWRLSLDDVRAIQAFAGRQRSRVA